MKQLCFLLPEAIVKPSSLFGAIEIFEKANEFYINKGEPAYYDIRIVGIGVKQSLLNSQLTIGPTIQKYKSAKPDIIIIPALFESSDYSLKENAGIIRWIKEQYSIGCEVASLCTGAFFLAATGLLKGRECSTHWKSAESFIKMYPDVKLCTDKIITDSKGIYTAGGATSSLNLVLYLVEKYNGRQAALYCSKILQIDIDRNSQSQFILFEGQKNHGDELIKKVQQYIERNIGERVTVEFLADEFNLSKRSFIRRFKKATNNVPIEYIQKVKMEAAKKSFESTRKNVNEVMYDVGYSDLKAFRNVFRKITGLSPLEYRNKYNKEAVAV
jgi:transcriptional regulator GlxA family with amidase domain